MLKERETTSPPCGAGGGAGGGDPPASGGGAAGAVADGGGGGGGGGGGPGAALCSGCGGRISAAAGPLGGPLAVGVAAGIVGAVGAAQKGRPRKRKLTPVAPVSPLPLGADLGHHQHLAMRLSAQALEMVGKGELSSSIDSLGYESGALSQELCGGMEGMSYDCGVGSPGSLSAQGQQRTKRMRTSFKHHQLRTMKSYFAINQNPDAKDLKQLAQKTGLSKRVLQVWFQNARAKWRRNMMRQENGQQAGAGGPHGGGGGGGPGAGPGGGGTGTGITAPGGPGGGGLGLQDASLEELHHHHAHHLVHPGGPLSTAPLTLADLY
ncbi:hypothetical protein ONE63_001281 [Megalurothrips usitatus]|uniref:Homeobox domain-containing protein n=1 Tax=Megalurothrips usitatus TaxID=439358 RepID=A0AAV7XFE9_9NEOP|nr:hypothetical protein ONE63_001281 [Megalurothrips usitatus]